MKSVVAITQRLGFKLRTEWAKDINGKQFYGADNYKLSDLTAQRHDIRWSDLNMNAGFKDFFTTTKAIGADWQLAGRAFYVGIKNLTTNPLQALGSLGMGIGSSIAFLPKTVYYPFKLLINP